jgi:K+/H+ antiporter YhaU regulatory subunit KhtT
MAVNISEIKIIIFCTKGRQINYNLQILYGNNEPDQVNPNIRKQLKEFTKITQLLALGPVISWEFTKLNRSRLIY